MPSTIRILDDHTINKIAAGEVIENPASVVKELVENALDAKANEIIIEIKGGGRQLIRITDNGCGMNADDALLCLERHATSKIQEVEDILQIATMGFRGEAVPSIAAVSKFSIRTSTKDSTLGTLVQVEGGKIVKVAEVATNPGTIMEVNQLFFNVPVRRKFQKSPNYDANEIEKTLKLLALAHPEITFQFISNEKTIFRTCGMNCSSWPKSHQKRVEDILGADFKNYTPIFLEKENCSIQGYIGLPEQAKGNRSGQIVFLNHRSIFSSSISYYVKEAFGTILPSNKFPIFILYLTLPTDWIDINVHPQKKEVRLRYEEIVKKMIYEAVSSGLQSTSQNIRLEETFNPFETLTSIKIPEDIKYEFKPSNSFFHETTSNYTINTDEFPFSEKELDKKPYRPIDKEFHQPSLFAKNDSKVSKVIPIILSILPGYLLCESKNESMSNELIIINQKAAHTRIIFEQLKKKIEKQTIAIQQLLIPEPIDLDTSDDKIFQLILPRLDDMGLEITVTGNKKYLLHSLPQCFGNIDLQTLIKSLIDFFKWEEKDNLNGHEQIKKIAIVAARSSISSKQKLNSIEAHKFLQDLFQCENNLYCPNGKKILFTLSLEEISKLFKG